MDAVSEWELLIFGIAAILTAAITAVAGAGGGMVLLIVMLQFVDPIIAVPAHGVVQLFANGTRSLSLRSEVDAPMMRWFLLPLVPAMIVGFLLADAIPRSSGRAVVGVFALMAVWWPAATAWLAPKVGGDLRRFALVGVAAGILHPTIGAPGPLISPAFRTVAATHVSFVATSSLAQSIGHALKVVIFVIAGFAFLDYLPMILIGVAGVMLGTRVGVRYIRRIDERVLTGLFKVAVTAGALRLIAGLF